MPTELPPSPPPLPLLGNVLDVGLAGTPWNLMLQLEPKYGPVTRLQLPIAGDFYLVHNPKVRETPQRDIFQTKPNLKLLDPNFPITILCLI